MTLNDRIDAAIKRITSGAGVMRIPADETDPDLVLADCKALNAELVKALEVIDLKTSDFTHYSHNDECRRSTDCDEADEDHHCITHWHELDDTSPRDCPSCECGITSINESNAIARAVLAKARGTS